MSVQKTDNEGRIHTLTKLTKPDGAQVLREVLDIPVKDCPSVNSCIHTCKNNHVCEQLKPELEEYKKLLGSIISDAEPTGCSTCTATSRLMQVEIQLAEFTKFMEEIIKPSHKKVQQSLEPATNEEKAAQNERDAKLRRQILSKERFEQLGEA